MLGETSMLSPIVSFAWTTSSGSVYVPIFVRSSSRTSISLLNALKLSVDFFKEAGSYVRKTFSPADIRTWLREMLVAAEFI